MTTPSPAFLDGNAAAGELRELFAVDLTAAVGRCAGCGTSGPVGQAHLYSQAPGLVLRCPSCESVLLRLVVAEGRTWLDMRGLVSLQIRT